MGESGSDRTGSAALLVGGVAAILASTCCLGPLVLVALGLSGAWIGNLTLLEPYRPFFIGVVLWLCFLPERGSFRPVRPGQPVGGVQWRRPRGISKSAFG